MSDMPHHTRRHVLRAGIVLSGVATTGCAELVHTDDPTPGKTAGLTNPAEGLRTSPGDLARIVSQWTWSPAAETRWSRSTEPFDFRYGDRRWLVTPTEDGDVRCRVVNDRPPGNAGFYVDLGFVQDVERVIVESETVRSGGDADQQLQVSLYFDVAGDGDYFQWDPVDRREAYVDHGEDLEGRVAFPAGGTIVIDDDTELDLGPPFEEHPVTFGAVKREATDGIDPLTRAAVQVSVVGGGEGTVEEALVTAVTVDRPEPLAERWWSMYGYDMFNRGHNTASAGPPAPVEATWTFDTGGAVRSSPAVARGIVYVGSDDGFVYALSARTGEELWRFETGDRVRSSPTIEANSRASLFDDVVAVGSDDGSMYLLDAVSGDELYTLDTDGPVTSAPLILYTVHGDWEVGCGSADGHTYWWVPDFQHGLLNVVDAEAPVHAPVTRSPATDEDTWYRANDDGTLLKYARSRPAWRFEADDAIRTAIALTGGAVYVGSRDGHVYSIAKPSGEQRWAFETGGAVDSSPAIADGTLYVGSADGHIYALATGTGDVEWAFETGDSVASSPAVVDGRVYVGSDDGSVYALEAAE